jgi:NitT/TauT family transport system substrate-binding protein
VLCVALACSLGSPAPRPSGGPEKASLKLGVGGQSQIIYLPLILAGQLGYFRAQGVTVELHDLGGASKALEALLDGTVDVAAGLYEHTIRAQLQGRVVQMFVTFELAPGLVLMVGGQHGQQVGSIKDMTGHPVGVSSPGSPGDEMLRLLLKKDGLAADAVPVLSIGSGSTAVAAITSGQVWAGVTMEPAASQLERAGSARPLYDTRTAEGTRQVFGGTWPAGGLYAPADFLSENPRTVGALARAALKALTYIRSHAASEIASHLPPSFLGEGDRAAFVEMLQANLSTFSDTGRMSADGPNDVLETLKAADPRTDWSGVGLDRTFDNSFVQRAAAAPSGTGSSRPGS